MMKDNNRMRPISQAKKGSKVPDSGVASETYKEDINAKDRLTNRPGDSETPDHPQDNEAQNQHKKGKYSPN